MNKIQVSNQNQDVPFVPFISNFVDKNSFNKLQNDFRNFKLTLSDVFNDLLHTNNPYVKSAEVDGDKLILTLNIPDNEIGSVIWNKNIWDDSKMEDDDFRKEVESYRIVNAEGNEALTAKYINKYCGDISGSIVYLGQCWSGKDEILANAFLNKGAAAVIGCTKEIQRLYGNIMCYTTLLYFGKGFTLDESLTKAQKTYGETDAVLYPHMDGARPVIFGNSTIKMNSKIKSLITIQPWEEEERGKGGDDKIQLPNKILNQSELITKIIEVLPDYCDYKFAFKNETITKDTISNLNKNQIIVFQGHGSYINDFHEKTIEFPVN